MTASGRLVRNAARCLACGDVVESRHRHDFRRCSCGAIAVDGGLDYVRRVHTRDAQWDELCEVAPPGPEE